MDEVVTWLAASLARFSSPTGVDAPPDAQLLLASVFADFEGRVLAARLRDRVQQLSGGRVSLFRSQIPPDLQPRGPGTLLTVTGHRSLLLTPTDPPVEWVD
jgi:hypothetical protein